MRAPPTSDDALDPPSEDAGLKKWLQFLKLDRDDQSRLHQLGKALHDASSAYVDKFYAHLSHFEETSQFLSNEEMIASLKKVQSAHMASIFDAEWTKDFAERRLRVGQVHAERGIEPRFYLAAYGQFIEHAMANLDDPSAKDLISLWKAMLLDIGLTLDAYFRSATEDLRQALDMYWKANSELRHFAELASHDMKTPLATVANLCDEAVDEFGDQMPPEARDMIEAAKKRSFSMSRLIDELLDATITHDNDLGAKSISSELFITDAIQRLTPDLQEKSIDITLADSLPMVLGTRVQLCESFYNILNNSLKFIDKMPGKIEIDYEEKEGKAIFAIRDNGPGIPPEERMRVFAPFRRLAHHRDKPGSGLGLYFTKNLIEKQGGQIWVEPNDEGEGCCFRVALPLAAC